MTLKLRKLEHDVEHMLQPFDEPRVERSETRTDSRNVLVVYGTHQGRFPIGHMTIRDARGVLEKLIRIDPAAVAVVNGVPVDENQVIGQDVTMLTFVKPSSIRG